MRIGWPDWTITDLRSGAGDEEDEGDCEEVEQVGEGGDHGEEEWGVGGWGWEEVTAEN